MKQFKLFLAIFFLAFLPLAPALLTQPAIAHAGMQATVTPATGEYVKGKGFHVGGVVFAQEARADDGAVTPPNEGGAPVLGDPSAQEIGNIISAVGGWNALGTLGIIGLVIQILMLVMKSKLGSFSAGWQLTAVAGLSVIGAIVQYAMVHNVGLGVAAFSASALAAYQVLGNQVIKKLSEGKA